MIGEVLVYAIIAIVLIVLLLIVGFIFKNFVNKNPKIINDLKAKLMWNSVLRSIHQGYYRLSYTSLLDL